MNGVEGSRAERGRLVRGMCGGCLLLTAVVSLVSAGWLTVSSPAAAPPRVYGLREAHVKRSVNGRLSATLRVVASTDEFGVIARRYEASTPGPTFEGSGPHTLGLTLACLDCLSV